MSLAQAITQTMQAHGLKAAHVAERLGKNQDRATLGSGNDPFVEQPFYITYPFDASLGPVKE